MSALDDRPDPVLERLDVMIERLDVICAEAAVRDPAEPVPEVEEELLDMTGELRRILPRDEKELSRGVPRALHR